jgi:hypothetical protein
MNFKIFWILSIYTIWDGLSLKTISRYCPFKGYSAIANTVQKVRKRRKEKQFGKASRTEQL